MNRAVLSIVLLALLAHSITAETIKNALEQRDFERLYRAVVDISMTCYGEPGKAIGIIGDKDGSILKELRSNHFIPVVLVDGTSGTYDNSENSRAYKLRVFIIAVHSPGHLVELLIELSNYSWWNNNGSFLIVDTRPALNKQCSSNAVFMYVTTRFAMLNAQFICYDMAEQEDAIMIYNSNPFMPRAPDSWTYIRRYAIKSKGTIYTGFLFARMYEDAGRSCESINFEKTRNVGGHPLYFVTNIRPSTLKRRTVASTENEYRANSSLTIAESWIEEHRWFMDSVINALNASEVITREPVQLLPGIGLETIFLSSYFDQFGKHFDRMIMRRNQWPIFAVTQHTGHMTQLDKILSVVDRNSRIGVCFVYLITFVFFKFFLRTAVMPSLLDLARLTCNTGIATIPQNTAPKLYLTGLFVFVVTLQAIYTGNLATLLTTTIPYRNVEAKEDIPKLGYTVYLREDTINKLIADPVLDGCVVEIPPEEDCIDYVLRDPLAACVMTHIEALASADKYNLHVSTVPIIYEYGFHLSSMTNILRRRIEEVLVIYFEAGLSYSDLHLERLRLQFIDDDEVKKNTARRVMTFQDLRFAFVILGIGSLCSSVCFVGEIVICTIRFEYAKRRKRVRVLSVSDAKSKKYSLFRSLNCRFNLRRLFSNRR